MTDTDSFATPKQRLNGSPGTAVTVSGATGPVLHITVGANRPDDEERRSFRTAAIVMTAAFLVLLAYVVIAGRAGAWGLGNEPAPCVPLPAGADEGFA
ncbi:hypothetical protein [Wenjunlia tyrosinilytica]|jgi:hypothetical protein|uniref:Uncharacterized protein n=1 Tax=Wenjunlia tyrosinilytica TaxID=1544741 RepID=A0A917ZB43_9ACTN|nr:hypothetical protein [Wenjunlia tyrosinilytica]GGO80060.1 hypothetical protein GCM10012280_01030 [Wenjunlia tyrosinilytica]